MTQVFGKPLDAILDADKSRHPELQIPYFLTQAVRHVIWAGFDSEGIFRLSGNADKVREYRTNIDKGVEIDFVKEKSAQNDVCSLLKMYLRELPKPVLDSSKYDQWLAIHDLNDKDEQLARSKELISELPVANQKVLGVLLTLMGKLAYNSHIHKMGVANLATVLGPNMLWNEGPALDPSTTLVHSQQLNEVIELMIDNYSYLFSRVSDLGDNTVEWAGFYAKLFGHKKSINCVAIGFEDKQIWSCDSSGAIWIWDAATLKVVKEIDTKQGRIFTMHAIGDKTIATAAQGSAKIWDTESGECIKEIPGFAYCFCKVGDTLWIGGENKISVYNEKYELVKNVDVPGNDVITAMCLDSEGLHVWTGSTNKSIRVFEVETGALMKEIKKVGKINALAASDDKVWSGDEGHLYVWNSKTFEKVKQLDGHQGAVYDFQLCGDFMWSASWDTSIKVWNTETLECVCTLKNYHNDAVSQVQTFWNEAAQSWQAWTGSWDKSLIVWDLGPSNKLPSGPFSHQDSKTLSKDALNQVAKNLELRAANLQEKRKQLEQRKTILEERKTSLEEKKSLLNKKREQLQSQV